eukprot:4835483-Pleurochrysis_carterae.AAC.6
MVLETDCWDHLRNVLRFRGFTAALAARLRVELKDELEKIESRLRVGVGIEALLRAVNEEFFFCANHPMGYGICFESWWSVITRARCYCMWSARRLYVRRISPLRVQGRFTSTVHSGLNF